MRVFAPFVAVAIAIAAACGGAGSQNQGSTTGTGGLTGASHSASSASSSSSVSSSSAGGEGGAGAGGMGGAGGAAAFTTLFTIVLENHDFKEVVGSPNAPYLNSLIADGGLAANYFDSGTHPSLPNYLTLICGDPKAGGGTFGYPGGVDVNPDWVPWFPAKFDNLGTQMEAAAVEWRSYQENMGAPCNLDTNSVMVAGMQHDYAPKHDPFLYFDDIQNGAAALCQKRNVDYSQFSGDLAAGTYRYMWITPDLEDDGHEPQNDPVTGLKNADTWLSQHVPEILASATFKAGGVLFITWDEAEGRNGDDPDQIPMIILSPRIVSKGYMSKTKYSHKSYLATVEDMLGLPRLDTVKSEPSMMDFFK